MRRSTTAATCVFSRETAPIRDEPTWRVAGAGPGLHDRRVEITGPTDRRMTVNALNSGAKVWRADQEDATSPTWQNVIGGQLSLFDAIRGQIDFVSDEGKEYRRSRHHADDRDASARLAPRREAPALRGRIGNRRARPRHPSSTSAVFLPQREGGSSSAARGGRTSTCRSSRTTSRRGCGTTSSPSRRTPSASRTARSAPRC